MRLYIASGYENGVHTLENHRIPIMLNEFSIDTPRYLPN